VHGAKDKALMRMALQNLVAFAQSLYRPLSRGGADDTLWSAQEGANLLYWANEHFPGRKLIVWAHNGHIIRNTSKVEELGAKFKIHEYISAGDHVRRAMGEQAYSIMFLTHGGNTGMWWDEPRDVRPAGDNSIESLFHQAGLGDSFLDLRRLPADHWLSRPQVASPIAHQPMRAAWPDCFDGIVYIDEMTPSEKR